jgi:Zn-dependent protease with chaperone function
MLVAAALALPARAVWRSLSARRRGRAMVVEPWVGEHRTVGDHELVVLPSGEVVACSVEGPPPQIVISRALVDALSEQEFDAVVRHESAHLRHHHERLLRVGAAFEGCLGFLPWAESSASALRSVLERWADEQAAGGTQEQRAALQGALLRVAGVQLRPSVAGISRADALVERVEALGRAPAAPRLHQRAMLYLPGTALAAVFAVAVAHWGHTIGPACLGVARCIS